MSLIRKILGIGPKTDFKLLLQNGAQIIDVRTPGEFKQGNVKGSINIPLQSLQKNLPKIKKDKPIITCCASGMRSAQGKAMLKANGFNEVYNGGGWIKLRNKIS